METYDNPYKQSEVRLAVGYAEHTRKTLAPLSAL